MMANRARRRQGLAVALRRLPYRAQPCCGAVDDAVDRIGILSGSISGAIERRSRRPRAPQYESALR
ncbi:hypothetical protein QFZ34_001335 [Phyllobacterium ifriqiyense]|uniref:Uncharacterized protein n=1 Tax=Phyllobacterium ifriqiyense TaxID=314238 RepID=A0ABU0S8U5_9HYPH|nr:hypothetical protein [Phyllobacterium ifriqiyense]